ncbi:MAG: efflux RND transporter periplasmic adaptor subunit, partial [Methylococcaceae bacterium]|nr:efflux RND transporter periplasmic adaptor subunit [Methylococcaceae bacterium]
VEVFGKEGDRVRENQPLMQLDERIAQANVKRAKANLALHRDERELARLNWQRLQGSSKAGGVSRQDLDSARIKFDIANSRYEIAEAEVDIAAVRLQEMVLRAPAASMVVEVNVRVGEWTGLLEEQVKIQTRHLFHLVDPQQLYIKANIDAADMASIRPEREVRVSSDLIPGAQWGERVEWVSPLMQEENGSRGAEVRISLKHSPNPLPVGAQADLMLIIDQRENALLVPFSAIKTEQGKVFVGLIENGLLRLQPVEIGLEGLSQAEILSGLAEGQELVLWTPDLVPGMRVSPVLQ